MPRTHMLSFTAIGTPANGPSGVPDARSRSMLRRALERPVTGNQVERVQRGVEPFNAIQRVSTDVNSRDPAVRDIPRQSRGSRLRCALIR